MPGCTQTRITETAAKGLDYGDTLVLLRGNDTEANKKAWAVGSVQFKLALIERQQKSTDVRMLIHLGKHYLGQQKGGGAESDFDVKVILDGDTNQAHNAPPVALRAVSGGAQ